MDGMYFTLYERSFGFSPNCRGREGVEKLLFLMLNNLLRLSSLWPVGKEWGCVHLWINFCLLPASQTGKRGHSAELQQRGKDPSPSGPAKGAGADTEDAANGGPA